ncbi:universal stress protein [Salisediminibacterium halotolerans]|uniref:Nucleotide-binding universal stress protein, UspA family n=1 Tax=Salisediminibacterium halotolerans TaxID=517425 RepID=A0A1H9RTB4_9BACI|nr:MULTISPECIES: universal stress protein [Salisediminibacterium]RLJ74071.1 nucleotide-binding universal stress UspA family protein [Actinophytocola xinjiangensis]RPE87836.1 nucleotide-binding universal stress UspA family protein [Salisediminibacterium halotolerans]TWG34908.1 nucleotide-binding universal stress UspA family protein [Salisediminibacterium halotolerans]SER75788.1 Nucleotide-binding universal stress protein, UspA family [Salisediminibacterium haloalkalitolerans]GEL07905.1 universa
MFKHIVLAADGSAHSIKAAEKAAGIAQLTAGSAVTLLHVVDDLPTAADVADEQLRPRDIPDHRKQRLFPVEEVLINAGVTYETKHIYGDPAMAIVKEAEAETPDLLIIGSRGLNPVQQMVLGSVSQKVVKRATCPVMIVKDN